MVEPSRRLPINAQASAIPLAHAFRTVGWPCDDEESQELNPKTILKLPDLEHSTNRSEQPVLGEFLAVL